MEVKGVVEGGDGRCVYMCVRKCWGCSPTVALCVTWNINQLCAILHK